MKGLTEIFEAKVSEWIKLAGGTWGIAVEDLNTGVRWSHNENRKFYAASVIKVPIMAAAFSLAREGKLSLEDRVRLTKEMQVGGAGVLQHLNPGLELSIRDLVILMIIQSDNTATNMVIDAVGKEKIRETMEQLGMRNSTFYNKLMIVPAQTEGTNLITAADMASCFKSLATGKAASSHDSSEMIDILKRQQVTDGLPSRLPNRTASVLGVLPAWKVAHKTGTVENIQHDAGILYTEDQSVMIIVLSEGVPHQSAKEIMGKITREIYDQYSGR